MRVECSIEKQQNTNGTFTKIDNILNNKTLHDRLYNGCSETAIDLN